MHCSIKSTEIKRCNLYYALFVLNKPSAVGRLVLVEFLVHTCTENGLSDGTSETTVKNMLPRASTSPLVISRNWTTISIKHTHMCTYIIYIVHILHAINYITVKIIKAYIRQLYLPRTSSSMMVPTAVDGFPIDT